MPTADDLTQLARIAWRNNARCIGRLFWNTLELLNARTATGADEIFEACVAHLRHSTNGGKIRSAVTLFAPAAEGERGIRIWNRQLVRYAGYRAADGSVLGDPDQADFTARVMEMGWQPPRERTAFDILPLVIDVPGDRPRLYTLPADAVLEVAIHHPDLPWFAELGLKWHAVPVISDMALVGDGLRFPAAPFSGYYMGTEIGSRNFGDESRYNLLPVIAEKMGIDRTARRMLWKDRALVELNTAVLHSYREAGVAIVDHHTASTQFMQHVRNEEGCGREVPGDWSWLVPPLSGSACPVFHRYYGSERPEPAFVEQPPAW
ncbi:nitric oxide synthase oxygenase [Luteolibacter flavescens]|uniref:Nitric oxide synthase oxygenase n=1 Tax=Luteolibacter flavescens TaxID=1859460 RepID=A0ABT3FV94_9BACT|nr:nitric oxide synthase oxygenase [Luteolibacter flavescens]MCW1887134.1 nitric oxide synthase oxygenase [Luteolibacter flavescens]